MKTQRETPPEWVKINGVLYVRKRRKARREDRVYPCAHPGCKVMRTKTEGGTTFTVCDIHWK